MGQQINDEELLARYGGGDYELNRAERRRLRKLLQKRDAEANRWEAERRNPPIYPETLDEVLEETRIGDAD